MCQSRVGSATEVSVVVVVSPSCANSSCHAIGSSRSPSTPTAKDDPELTSPHPQSLISIPILFWQDYHQGDKNIRNSLLNGVDEFNSNRFTQTLPVMLWDLFPQPQDPPHPPSPVVRPFCPPLRLTPDSLRQLSRVAPSSHTNTSSWLTSPFSPVSTPHLLCSWIIIHRLKKLAPP